MLLEHAVVAVEVLAEQRSFEELDGLIRHDENMSWLNISMEEAVGLKSGASGGYCSNDVPHLRLGHPLSRVVSSESSSSVQLFSKRLFGVFHSDVSFVVLGAP